MRAPGRTVESRAMVDLLEGPPCLSMGPDPSYCGKGLGLFVKKRKNKENWVSDLKERMISGRIYSASRIDPRNFPSLLDRS